MTTFHRPPYPIKTTSRQTLKARVNRKPESIQRISMSAVTNKTCVCETLMPTATTKSKYCKNLHFNPNRKPESIQRISMSVVTN